MSHHLITWMILFPLFGTVLQAVLPRVGSRTPGLLEKWIALWASLFSSACGIILIFSMQPQTAELQASETLPWVGFYSISYEMGVDGLNAVLVLLISVLSPILIASEWDQKFGARGMHGLLLLLQTAFFGVACAQDLFLLFFFWAFSVLPFYFLMGIWGEAERESAAFRSVVAASIGNALFFAAMLLIYYSVDPHTFSIKELSAGNLNTKTFDLLGQPYSVSSIAFILIGLGLTMRAPVWPLHGWFTHIAEEAPLSVFVAFSALTIPSAVYIFLRLACSLFPETLLQFAHFIVVVGAVNLFLGGICATAQRTLRLLLSYLCISELGLLLVGIGSLDSAGLVGAVYQQLVLGLGLAGFGLLIRLLVERTGDPFFLKEGLGKNFSGLATKAPLLAVTTGVVITSLLGLPGAGGFVGHSLILIGSYSAYPLAVLMAGLTMILTTYYLFTMYRSIFLGKLTASSCSTLEQSHSHTTKEGFSDLTIREKMYLFPLVAGLLFFGLYPQPLLELIRPTVLTLLSIAK